jgi:hypothetical protein
MWPYSMTSEDHPTLGDEIEATSQHDWRAQFWTVTPSQSARIGFSTS